MQAWDCSNADDIVCLLYQSSVVQTCVNVDCHMVVG